MTASNISPESLLKSYDFSAFPIPKDRIETVRTTLIYHFSLASLRQWEQKGTMLTGVEILMQIPGMLGKLLKEKSELTDKDAIGLTSLLDGDKPKKEKKYEKGEKREDIREPHKWLDTPGGAMRFRNFIEAHYEPSEHPSTKWIHLMRHFNQLEKLGAGEYWNEKKYGPLCSQLNIKTARIKDPRYQNQGPGTCFAHLKRKTSEGGVAPLGVPVVTPLPTPIAPAPVPVAPANATPVVSTPLPVPVAQPVVGGIQLAQPTPIHGGMMFASQALSS